MAKRVLVAINPRARRGRDARTRVIAALRARGHEIVEWQPDDSREGLSRAIVAHGGGVDAVVVGGGDGTLLRAIPGLLQTHLPLAIIPLGTFNDLARTLGVPAKPEDAATLLDDGIALAIDVGCVNGVHYFNEASVGLSTRVARLQTSRMKRALGMLAIPVTTFRALRWLRPLHLEFIDEGGSSNVVRSVQLTVANNYHFGGIVEDPEGSLEDGALWLYSIDVRGWWSALRVIAAIVLHRFRHMPEVLAVKGRSFSVRSVHGRHYRVFADSENVAVLPAEFSVVREGVSVFVPRERVSAIR